LWCLHRQSGKALRKVYLSAGIHGNEPAGPLATLDLLQRNQWPADAEIWICPCLNPAGFRLNTRGNAAGVDLNRDYRQPTSAEAKAHIALLEQLPDFDLAICLHEDWEARGFYLYELNATGRVSFAESIIEAVSHSCPIDPSSQIDGLPADGGIIRPEMDPRRRPEWPEAFYLFVNKTRLSLTVESPSDFELTVRVRALTAATLAALKHLPTAS
jgi:predicted deacylase